MGRSGHRGGAWAWRPYPRLDGAAARRRPHRRPDRRAAGLHRRPRSRAIGSTSSTGACRRCPPRQRRPGSLLIHGLSKTAWTWTPVARRLRSARHVVAMDLRGHGLSDAPTEDGAYDLGVLAGDVVAVAEGSGLLAAPDDRVVLAGHGFGAIVAAETAIALGARCAGLVLVDGGWEALEAATGLDVDEFLRGLDEPPGGPALDDARSSPTARRSIRRRGTPTRSARRGRRSSRRMPAASSRSTRPHASRRSVRAMFAYDPMTTAARRRRAGRGPGGRRVRRRRAGRARPGAGRGVRRPGRRRVAARSTVASFRHDGHNLMRYRPDAVSAAILVGRRRGRRHAGT